MSMYDINSIEQLVEVLGGPTVLGEEFGITQEAVSNWGSRVNIPGSWHIQLLAMASRKNLRVNPKVFNLTEKQMEGLFPPLRPRARAEAARAILA
jgi:hypothetical protein